MMQTVPTTISTKAGRRVSAVLLAAAVALLAAGPAPAQDALRISPAGNVGLGLDNPVRQLHLRGPNATFRMDRSENTAAFFMVRTNAAGTPLKGFQVGTNASGPNNGEFIISDMGTAVSGGGTPRLRIRNNGVVEVQTLIQTSSQRFKEDVAPLADALALARQLQGVRFVWKDSGRPALGLVAEDVAAVLPELVERDADGQAAGVNYSALVAVLVEAVKEQAAELAAQRAQAVAQQVQVNRLERRLAEFETLEVRLNQLEGLLIGPGSQTVAVSKP